MSTTIDSKVVEMKFDNRNFESNVATTMSTLGKLKQALHLDGASKGLDDIASATGKVNSPMGALGNAVETVRTKFSALQVMGVTALANLTNSAVNAGKRMVSALTIDPIKQGFSEYETQINAVQTILANTESKGTTLQQVNSALDTLNTYADKTIYNFTEMTKNIGTFTAAGVDLETSVNAIQGIANLAAVSGSTSQQASTAMYQLSQALSSGTVKLMDWNSVVNAGMGGQVFQDALKETARNHGVAIDKMIKDEGSFRETLKDGWLTADILTETLSHFTMAAEEGTEQWNAYKKSLMDQGYTAKQAEEIIKLSNTATNAATKVKTFTQLWDTLKESAQSGWTQTWEIIVGDFEEAKGFLTAVSDKIGGMIGASADARNAILSEGFSSGWKQLLGAGIADEAGYKETFSKVAKDHGVSIETMIAAEKKLDSSLSDTEAFQKALKTGFKDGSLSADMLSESVHKMANKMSKMSAEELKAAGYTQDHVTQIKELSAGLKDGSISMDDFVKKITRTSGRENVIRALWNSFDGLMSVVKPIKEAFSEVFKPLTGEQVYSFTEALVKFTEKLTLTGETADKIKRIFKGLFSVIDIVRKVITTAVRALFGLSQSEGIGSLADFVLDTAAAIGDFFTSINKNFDGSSLAGIFSGIGSGISSFLKGATDGLRNFGSIFSTVGNWIVNAAKKIFNGLKTVFTWISDNVSIGDVFAGLAGGGIFVTAKKLSGLFDTIKDAIDKLFNKGGLEDLKETFTGVLDSVKDSLTAFTSGIKVWSLVGIAVAVGILAHSLRILSELKAVDIGKSLIGISLALTALMLGFKSMTKSLSGLDTVGMVKSGIALVLLAAAVSVLADAMVKMAELPLTSIGKGLVGIAGGVAILCGGLKLIGKTKISLSTSIAMIALATACSILGDALKKFGEMSWDEIKRGLAAMGGALGELAITLKILKKAGGTDSLLGSAGILITVLSLSKLADALKKFGQMSWGEIGRGLSAMGGALAELGIVLAVLGKIGGFDTLLSGGAIFIAIQGLNDLADALKKFGQMSWGEIGRGLSAMGGALAELGIVLGGVGKLAGVSSLFASGSIWITVQGLSDLADAFKKFGQMSWDEIGRGLVGMGGALLEVGVITGALGYLTNIAGILGAASIWVAVQGLGDLADAFKKFGEMSWDEIKRGLAAMGGALGEVALGGLLNTLSIIGSFSINTVAESLGVLADSVQKWKDVSVPENLGEQLGQLAKGIFKFTFDGSGASALATAAAPLGTLADSVKKWTGVVVPEGLGEQLKTLADGVSKFTFSGLGASAIAAVGAPLGSLADSVKKWASVTVPANLKDNLTDLADGIKAFSWTFMGGWSISAIVTPLSNLPDAISKWANVTVPATLKDDLTGLADGVKAFSWAFTGGWSISAIVGPLGDLAGAVKKWTDITAPEGLKDSLEAIADGISEFGLMDVAKIQAIDDNLMTLSTALKNFASVNVSGDMLVTFAKNIKTCSTELSGISFSSKATEINKLVSTMKKVNATNVSNVGAFVNAANSLNKIDISKIKVNTGDLSSAIKSIKGVMSSMSKTISSSKDSISKAMTTAMSGVSKAITAEKSDMTSAAKKLTEAVSKTVSGKKNTVTKAFKTLISGAVGAVRDKYSSFKSAGSYLVSGFAAGISENTYAAEAKAKAMAEAAEKAARDALAINSPSKVFRAIGTSVPEGFAQGISKLGYLITGSTKGMANLAISSTKSAMSRVYSIINGDMDMQPTIRPVIDLSDVRAGAAAVSGMFTATPSVGLLANVRSINTMMNRRNQNGVNDDVVSAINDLKKSLGDATGDTYTFGNITYGEDSAVSTAVHDLVRAIRMERRT